MLRTILSLVMLAAACSAHALTLTINSLGDLGAQDAGDGLCSTGNLINLDPGPVEWECTLRAALQEANANPGPVTINVSEFIETNVGNFSIINVGSGLPFISTQVTIAGDTHPNHIPGRETPLVVNWDGPGTSSVSGIRFASNGGGSFSIVRNIAITRFPNSGILISGGTGYLIQRNIIGQRLLGGAIGFNSEGNGAHGIDINGGSSMPDPTTIVDNVIVQNGGDGIHLRGGTATTIIGLNVIGLLPNPGNVMGEPFRVPDVSNGGAGIHVAESAGGSNHIGSFGGNTISGNEGGGIRVQSDWQEIRGNLIGLPHDFQAHPNFEPADYGNSSSALILESSNNTVGVNIAGDQNYIGNAEFVGIRIGDGSASAPIEASDNVIRGNVIGTDPDEAELGQSQGIRIDNGSSNEIDNNTVANNSIGIEIRSSENFITRNRVRDNVTGIWARQAVQIGSLDPADANIIGSNSNGIRVAQSIGGVSGLVQIINNYIGTNADGDNLGNTTGVRLEGERLVWLGFPGNGNVIGNSSGSGVWLTNQATNKQIQANWIGAHPNGQSIGNLRGVRISGSAVADNSIGFQFQNIDPDAWFPGAGPGNVIANNSLAGVDLSQAGDASTGNMIRGNQFYANNGTGIDLGMTQPDPGGASSGPNNQMNFPEIDAAQTFFDPETDELHFRYRVQTSAANAVYALGIDFYLADGNTSEGLTYLGFDLYQSAQAGSWKTGTLTPPTLGEGIEGWIIATATDSAGNTSQFTIDGAFANQDLLFRDRFQ